jgi:hypothetical protein
MRIASRVIGVVLGFAGLAFLALAILALTGSFDGRSVLADRGPSREEWSSSGFAAAIGIVLLVFAWYFLRMDTEPEESPRAPSRVDLHVAAHRRELALIAAAGCVASLARVGAVSAGIEWPGGWAGGILVWLAVALGITAQPIGGMDWNRVPESRRLVVKTMFRAGQLALVAVVVTFAWNQWHQRFSDPAVESGFSALLFGWAAISFSYGHAAVAENEEEKQRRH